MRRARELSAAIQELEHIHRLEFEPATAPDAPYEDIDERAVVDRLEADALVGIGRTQLRERRKARADAQVQLPLELERLRAAAADRRIRHQAELDAQWTRLLGNDEQMVCDVVNDAFADNDAPALCLGVDDQGAATLAILVPNADALPDEYPAKTKGAPLI